MAVDPARSIGAGEGRGDAIFDAGITRLSTIEDAALATGIVEATAEDMIGKVWLLTGEGADRIDPEDQIAT